MMRRWLLPGLLMCAGAWAAEERIRGVLEKTARPDACAQITDMLDETYYIAKSDAAEKMIAQYVGRNVTVVVTGTVETRAGTQGLVMNLASVEKYTAEKKK